MRILCTCWLAAAFSVPLLAQDAPRGVHLAIQADSAVREDAAMEYRAIWQRDGARIVAAMERFSGLRFREDTVPVLVVSGASSSGHGPRPMRLRASYPEDTKRATLIHELGHRLQTDLYARGEDDHSDLFLWLYDTWVSLYGHEFADAQVAVEGARINRVHDYAALWRDAIARGVEGRAAAWQAARDARRRRTPPN